MARPVFKRGLSTGSMKPSVGREEQPKMSDLVELYDWGKAKEFKTIRAVGPVQSRGVHKIKVKKKDGSEIEITKTCLKHNPETDDFDEDKECPYCEMPEGFQRRSKRYFVNVIDRLVEEDAPANFRVTPAEEKSGFKAMDSKSWTPMRVLSCPSMMAERLLSLSARNVVKNAQGAKKQFDFNHDKYGFDLDVSFDPKSKTPANMYQCDRNQDNGRFTPLDETQLGYLLWNIDEVALPEDLEAAKREAKGLTDRWAKAKNISLDGDDSDDEDEEADHMANRRKPAAKKTRRQQEEDEYGEEEEGEEELNLDDDGEEPLEEEEEEFDPPPRRPAAKKGVPAKKGAPAKKTRRPAPEPEEEEFSEEEEESFEEEEAPRRPAAKKGAKPAAKKKAPWDDEEGGYEEEDYGEESEEEEEFSPPPRRPAAKKGAPAKKAGKPARKQPSYDELDELDDETFDE